MNAQTFGQLLIHYNDKPQYIYPYKKDHYCITVAPITFHRPEVGS
jgi:hypothetical protein